MGCERKSSPKRQPLATSPCALSIGVSARLMGDEMRPLRIARDCKAQRAELEQRERLLEQMRKCVLVHHQLSCLLIHNEALQAGLYDPDQSGDQDTLEVERSIQNFGGSTSRLFSVALRDQQDLQSMEDTLQQRVDEMIHSMQSEFELAGRAADCPAKILALASLEDEGELRQLQEDFSLNASALSSRTGRTPQSHSEVEALTLECEQTTLQLHMRNAEIASLRKELDVVEGASIEFHDTVTSRCFDEVQRITNRNTELEDLLEKLGSIEEPGALSIRGSCDNGGGASAAPGVCGQAQVQGTSCAPEVRALERGRRTARSSGSPTNRTLATRSSRMSESPRVMKSRGRGNERPRTPGREEPALAQGFSRPFARVNPKGSQCAAACESLAELDVQLRVSQSGFWGM